MAKAIPNIQHLLPEATCTACGLTLKVDKFRIDKHKPRGRSTKCKECEKEVNLLREARNIKHRDEAISQGHARPCRNCKITKQITEFPAAPSNLGGSSYECHECFQIRHKGWRIENVEHVLTERRMAQRRHMAKLGKGVQAARVKKSRLKIKYGLTADSLQEMKDAQGNKCRICECGFHDGPWHRNSPAVDHDHVTGDVRAILCMKCNRGLGLFNDDPSILARAAGYLAGFGVKKWLLS